MRSAPRTVDSRCAMTKVVRPLRQALDRRHHQRLGLDVERRGRLVEDQDRRVAQDRAGDGEALLLAFGERRALSPSMVS